MNRCSFLKLMRRPIRATLFVLMGLSAIFPVGHLLTLLPVHFYIRNSSDVRFTCCFPKWDCSILFSKVSCTLLVQPFTRYEFLSDSLQGNSISLVRPIRYSMDSSLLLQSPILLDSVLHMNIGTNELWKSGREGTFALAFLIDDIPNKS